MYKILSTCAIPLSFFLEPGRGVSFKSTTIRLNFNVVTVIKTSTRRYQSSVKRLLRNCLELMLPVTITTDVHMATGT